VSLLFRRSNVAWDGILHASPRESRGLRAPIKG
jgi:hypothetical protein